MNCSQYLVEGQHHLALVGRLHVTLEKIRCLLENRAEGHGRATARHTTLELRRFDQDSVLRIDRRRFEQPCRQVRHQVDQLQRYRALGGSRVVG